MRNRLWILNKHSTRLLNNMHDSKVNRVFIELTEVAIDWYKVIIEELLSEVEECKKQKQLTKK